MCLLLIFFFYLFKKSRIRETYFISYIINYLYINSLFVKLFYLDFIKINVIVITLCLFVCVETTKMLLLSELIINLVKKYQILTLRQIYVNTVQFNFLSFFHTQNQS